MKLQDGITYMHEHMSLDLSGIKKDADCKLDNMDDIIGELNELKNLGVANIIDVTNRGMGRDLEYALEISAKTGMNIAFSTGYYKEPFFPQEVYELSIKQLAGIMIKEIIQGIENTGIKAKVIGEVGTGLEHISSVEQKVLYSAAEAHVQTGKPITTHTTLGNLGIEQVSLFQKCGVDLNKVIIGHVDLSGDSEYVLRLIDKGVYVAFDTVGKINYMPEEKRLEMLKNVCNRGLSSRVLLSMDITRKSHFKNNGGLGYAYLLNHFVPYLINNGIRQADVDNMLKNNPIKFFS